MSKIAIIFICVLVAVGLMLVVPLEYRFATIAVLVVLAIFDAFADKQKKHRTLEFVKNGVLQILRPPLSFVLWLCDVTGDVTPLPSLKPFKGLSRAELKRRWVNSWLTAPARYLRSRIGGK